MLQSLEEIWTFPLVRLDLAVGTWSNNLLDLDPCGCGWLGGWCWQIILVNLYFSKARSTRSNIPKDHLFVMFGMILNNKIYLPINVLSIIIQVFLPSEWVEYKKPPHNKNWPSFCDYLATWHQSFYISVKFLAKVAKMMGGPCYKT